MGFAFVLHLIIIELVLISTIFIRDHGLVFATDPYEQNGKMLQGNIPHKPKKLLIPSSNIKNRVPKKTRKKGKKKIDNRLSPILESRISSTIPDAVIPIKKGQTHYGIVPTFGVLTPGMHTTILGYRCTPSSLCSNSPVLLENNDNQTISSQFNEYISLKLRCLSHPDGFITMLYPSKSVVQPLVEETIRTEVQERNIKSGSNKLTLKVSLVDFASSEGLCAHLYPLVRCEIITSNMSSLSYKPWVIVNGYQWHIVGGTYGRVAFGFIDSSDIVMNLPQTRFSLYYRLPKLLRNFRVLYHGSSKLKAGWVKSGVKMAVAIKTALRERHKSWMLYWEREREYSYSLAQQPFVLSGNLLQLTPTLFTIHTNSVHNEEQKLFPPLYSNNNMGIHSEILIMENLHVNRMSDIRRFLFSNNIINTLESLTTEWMESKSNNIDWIEILKSTRHEYFIDNLGPWSLWYFSVMSIFSALIASLSSFQMTGQYILYHCDLNENNILFITSMPMLRNWNKFGRSRILDEFKRLLMLTPNDIRFVDFSFVWSGKDINSRHSLSPCKSQQNLLYSDSENVSIMLSEFLRQHSYKVHFTTESKYRNELLKTLNSLAISLERYDEWLKATDKYRGPFNDWWLSWEPYYGPNAKHSITDSIEALLIGCSQLTQFHNYGIEKERKSLRKQPTCFSIEAYLRGYYFFSFTQIQLAMCVIRNIKNLSHASNIKIFSYFEFAIYMIKIYLLFKGFGMINDLKSVSSIQTSSPAEGLGTPQLTVLTNAEVYFSQNTYNVPASIWIQVCPTSFPELSSICTDIYKCTIESLNRIDLTFKENIGPNIQESIDSSIKESNIIEAFIQFCHNAELSEEGILIALRLKFRFTEDLLPTLSDIQITSIVKVLLNNTEKPINEKNISIACKSKKFISMFNELLHLNISGDFMIKFCDIYMKNIDNLFVYID
ncbi:uncharacterized protein CMU_018740 [Cryptosporidium muris RN66]|uniref:Uncharacterized protein n=1 Tax=Cryptosporidium muris (strain RN66) TaxID=441375 RepID=B6ADB3_CRYMR|nr:uncharacterized protein CMU_018740 [Cryptosporidium muris RN66]EEA06117.1 hypothetical protein, conserved [Cryptosporidium muris RN66]|eukprot:XP_002140466.1 hypothetical protein [Cryptosporidium muris RN66]